MTDQPIVKGGVANGEYTYSHQPADKRWIAPDTRCERVVGLDIFQRKIGLLMIQSKDGMEGYNLRELDRLGDRAEGPSNRRQDCVVILAETKTVVCGCG